MNAPLRTLVGAVVALTLLSGCTDGDAGVEATESDAAADVEVAAWVGGVEIPAAEVERLLEQVESDHDHADHGTDSLEHRAALSFLVRLALLEEAAAEHGIVVASNDTERDVVSAIPEETLLSNGVVAEDLERGLRASRLTQELARALFPDAAVSDTQVAAFHTGNPDMFAASWVIDGHILFFDTEPAATEARAALQGGQSVDEVIDTFMPLEHGPLEAVGADAPLPEPLRDAVAATPQGEVTPVISDEPRVTHAIVLVENRVDVPAVTLDEARPQIVDILTNQIQTAFFWDWFDERMAAADVRIDPRYGSWSSDEGTVIP